MVKKAAETRTTGVGSVKGILTFKLSSVYDDRIEEKYHFPNRYLATAKSLVGDWILYHEPGSDGGRKAYIAAARVDQIVKDPNSHRHFYALMRDFVPLVNAVPIKGEGRYYESRANLGGSPGIYFRGRSVRAVSEVDFAAILFAGLRDVMNRDNERLLGLDSPEFDTEARTLLETASSDEFVRRTQRILLNRPIREASFRHNVHRAYDYTCAVTGLQIRNGGGRPEVQACHIWSVEDGGPDSVTNGIALSQTAHWMFDRGLIGIRDDYSLIMSHNRIPEQMRNLIEPQARQIRLPVMERHRPDPRYLARHRDKHCL